MSGMPLFKSMWCKQTSTFIVKYGTNKDNEIEKIESLGNACKAY